MTTQTSFTKDPNAVLDYKIDWSAWLSAGDTIVTTAWTAPSGITVNSSTFTTTTTTIWLSGGTLGQTYSLTCHITTAGNRQDDRTITVRIVNK